MVKTKTLLFIFTMTSLIACSGNSPETKETNAPLEVNAMVIRPSEFSSNITATAEVMATEQVVLKAPMAGQVLEIHFKEGETVKRNQELIRLDDRAWQAQLEGLRAERSAAQRELDRKKQLLEIEGSSQEEIDRMESQVASLKAAMQELEVKISLANVKAPFNGQLGLRNFSLGAYLKEGDPITTLTDDSELKVDFDLAQGYESSIKQGKEISVIIEGDTFMAPIYAVDPQIDAIARTIRVRALLKQPSGKHVKPGTFAEVMLSTNQVTNALLVPSQAIVPQINDETVFVFKAGKAIRKTVQTGQRTADEVLVTSGLNAGDTVLTTGLLLVKEGMPVSIQKMITDTKP